MISLRIEDIKPCMSGLLTETIFDNFYLHSLDLKVLCDVHIEGQINPGYLSPEEKEGQPGKTYLTWKEIRPTVREIVKSYRTPLALQVNFILGPASREKVLKNIPENLASLVQSFSFRLQFESGNLRLITATNYKGFLPDKAAEHSFDLSMKQFLSHYGFVFYED